jgi:GMP synthase (glutamine-hydrolysing)
MTRSLRIAVLECDTPIPPIKEELGGYGEIFTRLLNKGLEASGDSTVDIQEISKWHVVDNPVYPDPNDYDAFLLSGSSMYLPSMSHCQGYVLTRSSRT